MALGLTPYVRRRKTIWWKLSIAHMLGGALGGLLLSVVIWSAALPVRATLDESLLILVGLAFATAAVGDTLGFPTGTPRQVPPTWLRRFGLVRGFGLYGAALGVGLTTKVNNWLLYAVVVALAFTEPFLGALTIGLIFGGARSAAVVLMSLRATSLSLLWRRQGGPAALRRGAGLASTLFVSLIAVSTFY